MQDALEEGDSVLSKFEAKIDNYLGHDSFLAPAKPNDKIALKNSIADLIKQSEEAFKKNEFKVGEKCLRVAESYDPMNIEVLGRLANLYFNQERFDEAYNIANRALQIFPDVVSFEKRGLISRELSAPKKPDYVTEHAISLRVRGAVYLMWGIKHWEKAKIDLTESLRLKTANFTLLQSARLHIAMGDLIEAQKNCDSLLGEDPQHFIALTLRAIIALKKNDLKQADMDIKVCESQIQKIGFDEFIIPALRAELCLLQNNDKKALEFINKSIIKYREMRQKDPEGKLKNLKLKDHVDYYNALLLRASLHIRRNALDDALTDYQGAIRQFPKKPEAFIHLGNYYKSQKDKIKADEYYKKAKDLEESINAK